MEDLIAIASSLTIDPKEKKTLKASTVFTIKMHQPPLADRIYGGKVAVIWSNINPGWLPQNFRKSPVILLRVFLTSTHLGGRRTLPTAMEHLGCATFPPRPLSVLSLDI